MIKLKQKYYLKENYWKEIYKKGEIYFKFFISSLKKEFLENFLEKYSEKSNNKMEKNNSANTVQNAQSETIVPQAGQNLPIDMNKPVSTEFKSVEKAPTRRRFGFCLEFECGDDCCCCI